MKKNLKKFFTLLILFPVFWIFQSEEIFAETNACVIKSGPIKEMTDYANNLNKQLSEIAANAPKNNSCNTVTSSAHLVFDAAYADIKAMNHIFTDFRYNMQSVRNGGKNPFVKRDEKFFQNLEKNIEKTAESLGKTCSLDDQTRKSLHALIIEVQTLRNTYQRSALWEPLTASTGIQDHTALIEAINQSYSPNATASCIDDSQTQKSFSESLKSMINLGGEMDNSLSTWRKALALIRGGGNGMSPSEVTAHEKSLLQSELSRQWLSQNAKNTILQNFDCYKANTIGTNNPENILSVRASCLQIPVTWVDKIFGLSNNIKSIATNGRETWNNFVWESNNTDTFVKRQEIATTRYNRSINIEKMHTELELLTSQESDNNKNTLKWLVDLHLNLMETNNLLEERLPIMQKNCMKWNPGIIGWCR